MIKKIFVILFISALFAFDLYPQDNSGLSYGTAPYVNVQYPQALLKNEAPNNYYSRAFAYNAYGSVIPLGPFKFWLTGTGLISLYTDPSSSNFIQAGCFACNGYWYGIRYGTNALVRIDTSTGAITTIATVTGTSSPTGLAMDYTTGIMYASNYASGNNQVGTINLTTGAVTLLSGTVSTTGILIDIACSNAGQLYGHVMNGVSTQSQIYSINKTTGAGTALPQTTGFIANYAQGMSWDRSVDTGYLAAYNYTTNAGELRKINIATGATTLIATLGCEADGMAIPPYTYPIIAPISTVYTPPFLIISTAIYPFCSGIVPSKTKLFWTRYTNFTDSILFTNTSGFNWSANMPVNYPGTYKYYLSTVDSLNRVLTSPAGAPTNYYTFVVSTDTVKPVITHTPLGNCFKINWPSTVNCLVTDNFGVDSVWVRWNKNHGSWNRFNLAHGTGNIWSNPFNSDTSQVTPGDSIFYRIVARDVSGLKDSTGQYGFRIINQTVVCIGTGTTSSNYPFTTYWEDGRTDMLYTAPEIIAAGGAPGNIISLSFDVTSVGGPEMNGFNVKMQNTTATSISAFTNSGWTVCFNGSFLVGATGWQTVSLTSPYPWNGTSNLLIEICYNNAAWTAYSPVNATSANNMMVGYCTDLPTGDGCTAAWTATVLPYRCNICIVIQGLTGIKNNIPITPVKYALFQNYPNPFNPVTQIKYDLLKSGFVTLKVFDILGREISRLVNEEKQPGIYIVDYDGTNLSSGVYFYKLEVNDFTDIKKMVIIK